MSTTLTPQYKCLPLNPPFFLFCCKHFRYKQRSVIKIAARFRTTTATDITALSAINDFYSRILCSL